MAVTCGYSKSVDPSAGEVRPVLTLKEISLEPAHNDHFVVFGTKREVADWLQTYGALQVTASPGLKVLVVSREKKIHKGPLEQLGRLGFSKIPNAGTASKLSRIVDYLTDAHPWIVHFKISSKRLGEECIEFSSPTTLGEVAQRVFPNARPPQIAWATSGDLTPGSVVTSIGPDRR